MAHSKIGASGMKRWEACPGSVRLSEGMESRTSEHAALGTSAHFLAETCLLTKKSVPADYEGFVIVQDNKGECWFKTAAAVPEGCWQFTVDKDMVDATTQYVDHVRALVAEDIDSELVVEHKFHLKNLHSDLHGTADAVIWQPGLQRLHVCDYKHGAGVLVEAKGNPQLLYYGLGALLENNYPADEVFTHVVQPRCPHPEGPARTEQLDVVDMMEFADRLLKAAKATEDPDAPLVPGDHCGWCPAAVKCPKLHDMAQKAAATDFQAEKDELTTEQLAEYLDMVPVVEAWCKNVRQFAYEQAEHGESIPRHKLVEKRPTRKWKDEQRAIAVLKENGLQEDELYTQKIKTPPQIEKLVGKSGKGLLEDLVIKESSGLALVHESDKRKAVASSAEQDFGPKE